MRLKQLACITVACSLLNSGLAFAYTNDDLRRLLGKPEIDSEEFHDYVNYLDQMSEAVEDSGGIKQDKNEDILSDEDEGKNESRITAYDYSTSLVGRVKQIVQAQEDTYLCISDTLYKGGLASDISSDMSIFARLDDSLGMFKNMNYFNFTNDDEQHDLDWYFDEENLTELQEGIAYQKTLMDDTYDIGHLTNESSMSPIRSNSVSVTAGYHGKRLVNNDTATNDCLGLFLRNNEQTDNKYNEVLSLFNGVVINIGTDEVLGNYTEVQSGKGLKVKYYLLNNVLVQPGDTVTQGQVISRGTSSIADGELYVEAELDGESINPIYLMGAKLFESYNKWVQVNTTESVGVETVQFKGIPTKSASKLWDSLESYSDKVDFQEQEKVNESDYSGSSGWDRDESYTNN